MNLKSFSNLIKGNEVFVLFCLNLDMFQYFWIT
jgi:hypothetical protein